MRSVKLFFLLALIFSLQACENDESTIKEIYTKSAGIEVADSVNINYTSGGRIKAILTSPLMHRIEDSSLVIFPNTLLVTFYNEEGVAESKLTSKYGKYLEYKNEVLLKDSVRVINFLKGDTLITDELIWDRQRTGREFYTNKPVKIRTKTQILDGIGMEANQNFKSYHIIESTGIIDVPLNALPQ